MAPTTSAKPPPARRVAAWCVLSTMLVLLAGCAGSPDAPVPLEENTALEAKLQQVIRENRTIPLRQITGGDWDRVHILPGQNTQDYVEQKVGPGIDLSGAYTYGTEDGGIIVFTRGNTIRRAIDVDDLPFHSDYATYGSRVIASPPEQGNYLELTEPQS